MQRVPAVSCPALRQLTGGGPRRSPVEIVNRTLHEAAAERSLPVAEVSAHFMPPWAGKFAPDYFHPSQDGDRDWTRALLAVI